MTLLPPTPVDDDDASRVSNDASISPAMDVLLLDSLGILPDPSSRAPPVPLPNPANAAATVAARFCASTLGGIAPAAANDDE